ncbi:hypothetical protein BJV78DRAFT_147273 [Lactifluus subvellereus]|nr:hypothetical protein BJV78DRAFT_635636 [Lactifluus subvellereus]KAI0246485.1 hypothetical protein BJV78DRAFT_147273 [Lactifluus subvellereus]
MSRLAILAPLLLLSGIVVAQISAPDCSQTSQLQWIFNSLGQNPCIVAAYLLATCNGGSWSISPLDPGSWYTVFVDDENLCLCNTVTYSLLSACGACQDDTWTTWSQYSFNCTNKMPVSSFPNPVPSGTGVPQWALLDVTLENNWNSGKSFAVGDSPELTPGMVISPSNASSTSPTQTPTPTTPSPTPAIVKSG